MNFVAPAGSAQDQSACPELEPPVWLKGGHLQTIFPALFGHRFLTTPPSFRRERLVTPDGDFLDLDWLVSPHHLSVEASPTAGASALLVLFHGLEGSSGSPYAHFFGECAKQRGWGYVVVHFRGCSGEINKAPRAYHSGDVVEIDWILSTLASRLMPEQTLLAAMDAAF